MKTESGYPRDADGDALRRVVALGANMDEPMHVDFTVDVPNPHVGEQIAQLAAQRGYITKVELDREDNAWTVYCMKSMIVTYESVVRAQEELNCVSGPLGAVCDGWGTFGNKNAV